MKEFVDLLKGIVLQNIHSQQKEWFAKLWLVLENQFSQRIFRSAFAGMGHRLRGQPKNISKEERNELAKINALRIDDWQLCDFGRIALLVQSTEWVSMENHSVLIFELFRKGDHNEKSAVLKALGLLPEPIRFVDLAAEACRTNALIVFEAIACDNVFPATYFPDHTFNQLVLKALFLGTSLKRIAGLNQRINTELVNMIADFKEERDLAGRPLPDDVEEIISKICSNYS